MALINKLTAIADAIRAKTGKEDTLTLDQMPLEIAGIQTGVELNFKVVGGTIQPTSPSENTIWVNTSTTITSWVFSATQPARATGRVWISIGTSSTVEFNALKNNNITTYPISAKQYVGGAWVDKTAKSYQGGKWVDWITYLYNKGNQYTALTGGWTSYGDYANITFNSDHIYLTIKSGYNEQWGMAHTVNKIDITNINTLCFYIDERTSTDITESSNSNSKYSTVGISVSPDVRTNGWTAYKRVPSGTTQTWFEVDVSAYSGTYYVCILNAVNASGYMKCSQVYGK